MQTKTTYQYLGTDVIISGVYDWLVKADSGLMAAMPVRVVKDNGVKYNVETTYPEGQWLDVGDPIAESSGAFVQRSAALYNLIHDIDVDKSQIAKDATQNKEAVEVMRQMRGFLNSWQKMAIYGQTTTTSTTKQPKGLLRLLAELESEATTDLDGSTVLGNGNNTQVVCQSATSSAFTLAALEMLDESVRLGTDAYIMSRLARLKLNALARAAGTGTLNIETDEWNHKIQMFNGAKIFVSDHMDNNFVDGSGSVLTIATHNRSTAYASGADNTVILAMNLSLDGVHIIQTGDIEKEPRFTVQNKDAWRHRVKWYTGFACFNKYALAGLINAQV